MIWFLVLAVCFVVPVSAKLVDVEQQFPSLSIVGQSTVTPGSTERVYHHIYSFETSCQAAGNTFSEWRVDGGVSNIDYKIISHPSIVSYGTRASRIGIVFLKKGFYTLRATCINQDGSNDIETFTVNVVEQCVSTCDFNGQKRCVDQHTRQQCGVSASSNNCLVWDSTWTCDSGNGEVCSDGNCKKVSHCVLGSVECFSGVYKQDYYSCELVDGVNRKVKRIADENTVCVNNELVDRFVEQCENKNLVKLDRLFGTSKVVGVCGVGNDEVCNECNVNDEITCDTTGYSECVMDSDGCTRILHRELLVGKCGIECLSDSVCGSGKVCDAINNKCVSKTVDPPVLKECFGTGLVECSDGFKQATCDRTVGEWIVDCEPVSACRDNGLQFFNRCVGVLTIVGFIITIIALLFMLRVIINNRGRK